MEMSQLPELINCTTHNRKKKDFMSINDKNSPASAAPDANAICYKDATELAVLIRTKQLSSREIVQAHLDRISTVTQRSTRS